MQIHWFSIINSILSVLLLTAILITIFMRALRRDFARYTTDDPAADDDESGWKYIHGDVFRFPEHRSLFCAFVGTGTQLLFLSVCIFVLALAGVFYPYNRGLLYTAQIVIYAMTTGVSGYVSAGLFRQMGGERWVRNIGLTVVIFAGPFFMAFCVLNTVAIGYRCARSPLRRLSPPSRIPVLTHPSDAAAAVVGAGCPRTRVDATARLRGGIMRNAIHPCTHACGFRRPVCMHVRLRFVLRGRFDGVPAFPRAGARGCLRCIRLHPGAGRRRASEP